MKYALCIGTTGMIMIGAMQSDGLRDSQEAEGQDDDYARERVCRLPSNVNGMTRHPCTLIITRTWTSQLYHQAARTALQACYRTLKN